jgi:hypothetical protein
LAKTKKNYWWLEKYKTKDSFYKEEKESSGWWTSSYKNPTRGWMEKLGHYDWGYSWLDKKKDKKEIAYKKLLEQLQTSINVINSDKLLKVKWSNGENYNSPESDFVYLSPNSLLEESDIGPVVKEEMVDILTGKVYLYKILHSQITKEDFSRSQAFKNSVDSKFGIFISKLWESLETNIAKNFIENNWCGFMPHVVKEIDYSSSDKIKVQAFLDSSVESPSLDAAILGISWNLVHEHNSVEIPDVYDACLDIAENILSKEDTEKQRFKACNEIVREISKILNQKISKSDSEFGGGFSNSRLKINEFKICDEQLFGAEVSNKVDCRLSELTTSRDSDSLVDCDECSIANLKNKFVIKSANDSHKSEYLQKVSDLKNVIMGIKNNFYFINNKLSVSSYGHFSGDIDENNLYKLRMNDDRVMSKTDVLSQKKISVCLLVDESGSMDDKYVEAINATIALSEGLREYFPISIYGHTAETSSVDGCLITEYYTPRNNKIESCVRIEAKSENIDGLAIELVAKKFYLDYPDTRRILFHISDGEPSGSYYGGESAEKHVNNVCNMIRSKLETEVYGIGVCSAFEEGTGRRLYGKNNFVVLDDVDSSVGIITRFLKQICNKNIRIYN